MHSQCVHGDLRTDLSVVPEEVLDSWIRSRNFGINPFRKPVRRPVSHAFLQDLLDRNKEFIALSRPFLENFYRFLEGSVYCIYLFDQNGLSLGGLVEAVSLQKIRKENESTGSSWNENFAGTNASGTVVALRKPIQILGSQHYLSCYHDLCSSSAPVFTPEGEFLGGVCLVGNYQRSSDHTLGMAVAAAYAIENEMRTQKALKDSRIANSYQKTVISSIIEALITIVNQGHISLINGHASAMFPLDAGRIEGKHIRKVFGKENHAFLNMIERNDTLIDVEVRIISKNSANNYTLTCNPILSPDGENIGKIIVRNEIKRVKTLVTNLIGANAKFRMEDIYGKNFKFLRTLDQARMVSRSNSSVLLLGKSGTGKDIFAQAIHNASARREGPYVAINCGAIPRDLIVSELFGHEEGAFTGSRRGGNQGKFELADGGTIFLDEIAETPLELQTALLRVIEDKSISRIGGKRVRPVDVRIIAATNKDLKEEIRKGIFREDLYYRINVFTIEMVPLSERLDDIPLLVEAFIKKFEGIMGKKIEKMDEQIIKIFMAYPWPGNIRELQNTIERMMNYVQTSMLTVDLIPVEISRGSESGEINSPADFERHMISNMLNLNLSKNEIARRLKVSRPTLYRKRKKHRLL
jgi:transcriptional regulator with PAS, ATPase and Fis domain